ncbi:hypothetical protein [Halomonas halocynthiae]|uniref:hypothetical protein n=1 Tax=Halomonas halocynthiae TaxID=176290 RepID=UPI00040BC035|nr:hypothetical protein [Halomonas halocynthiae]
MNRDLEGLRNHLFAQLEKLGNEDLDGDELKQEIERSKSINQLSASILGSAQAEIKHMGLTGQISSSQFMPAPRSPALPSNSGKGPDQ